MMQNIDPTTAAVVAFIIVAVIVWLLSGHVVFTPMAALAASAAAYQFFRSQ